MTPTRTPVRVRYPEIDKMGVAHHAQFFVWFEVGRTEFMRERGCPYGELEESGLFFPVIEAGATYRRKVAYDDLLVVETVLETARGPKVRFGYRLMRQADGEHMASGFTVHALIGRSGLPMRLPEDLASRLKDAKVGE